jgi:hypothetical protein
MRHRMMCFVAAIVSLSAIALCAQEGTPSAQSGEAAPAGSYSGSRVINNDSPVSGIASEKFREFPKSFRKDDRLAQGGAGIVLPGVEGSMTIPPLGAGFEYGIVDMVSAGAFFAMSGIKENEENSLVFSMAMKAAFHPVNLPFMPDFKIRDRIDPYVCAYGGANVQTTGPSSFLWGIAAGCRYYLKDYLALYAEAGRGIGYFNLGVTAKL